MAIKKQTMLTFTEAKDNNNKFYELILHDDDTLNLRWGRIGNNSQSKTTHGGEYEYNKTLRAKIAKGYSESKVVSFTPSVQSVEKIKLEEQAKKDILGDKAVDGKSNVLVKLIERLTVMNKHQLIQASGGQMKIDDSGLITTPLGLVTKDTVGEARDILNKLEKFVDKKSYTADSYIDMLNTYLKLIPQKVPTRRGWYENFFTTFSSLQGQNSLLDQLEGSMDLYKSKEEDMRKKMSGEKKEEHKEMFKTRLDLLNDEKIWKKIEKYYQDNINKAHVSSHLKLKNIYVVENEDWKSRYENGGKKLGNEQLLWHGTRAFNILSIFKMGLIIPRSGGSYQITGRMFGDGLYFSDQSSKSLNYSYGYWDGGTKDDNCFMFLADVAMGKSYTPSGPTSRIPSGYDSTFAKGRQSGVANNEMIVYDINQANLRYLCEFSR
jgi:poly [ADP-ribose] polymerase